MNSSPSRTTTAVIAFAGLAIVVPCIFCCRSSQSAVHYSQVTPIRDPERRQERLDDRSNDQVIDTSAFIGMPQSYTQAATNYLESALAAIKAPSITRRRYYHKELSRISVVGLDPYPDSVNPVFDREAIVPIMMLPRPDAVGKWAASSKAHALGWRTQEQAIQHRGTVYGRTLFFEPGKLSESPRSVPASPFEASIPSWDDYAMFSAGNLRFGKVVLTPHYDPKQGERLTDRSESLRFGEEGGARLLGELITVPAQLPNHRLFWTSCHAGTEVRQFLAYSLLDGNGARPRRTPGTTVEVSPYVRPLVCKLHQPKIKQHEQLLLPVPLGWPPTLAASYAVKIDEWAHEIWCLDDWFPAQKNCCWVVRETDDSQPLQESFELMPATEESDRPAFLIALFVETEPRQLLLELAALHNVSPDSALDSKESMDQLSTLYDQLRRFRLGQ